VSDATIIRVPCDEGGADPLVRTYATTNRLTCAAHILHWWWIPIGMLAALAGGVIASLAAGPPEALAGTGGAVVRAMHHLLGNPWAALGGMFAGGALAALLGARLRPDGVPAAQEPWFGAALAMLAYLLLFDALACLGVVVGALCLVYALAIGFRLLALGLGGRMPPKADLAAVPADADWPMYTVLVPLYREPEVAASILTSLGRLNYPRERLDVKLLLEADDPETLPALERAGLPDWIEVIIAPPAKPKTKPRACNHGLARARGEFLVIFDAEDRPEPDQLKQAVMLFRASPANTACIQAQLAYHNHDQNLLTRWFAIEYNVWFRRYLSGLSRLRVPLPLGGTSNHFRTAILRDLGGWDPFNVTEDCDLGVRLHVAGYRTRMLDSITWEEANSRVGNWIRQRSRWLKGYLITHLVWWRRPLWLLARLGPWGALGFTLSVFCVAALSALNLVLWLSSAVYLGLLAIDVSRGFVLWELLTTRHPVPADPLSAVEPVSWQMLFLGRLEDPVLGTLSAIFFIAAICLTLGNLAFIVTAAIYGRRPGQQGLLLPALLSPLYWVLISLAAWKGLWEVVSRPHYWQKTVHGLGADKTTP
jgi:cellulose synthase/poly-beta-1,6-N-acetylglucosamine synthase-like glycosyltransferase